MAEEVKFTEEEKTELAELQKKFNGITVQLGQIKIERLDLDIREEEVLKVFGEARQLSRDIASKLSVKYGSGTFNPETGVFTPDAVQPQAPVVDNS